MASNMFILKCKTEKGPYTLNDLNGDCTVQNLKNSVQKLTQIRAQTIRILCGYPPKALSLEQDSLKLCEVNINSGDTVIIETLKEAQVKESFIHAAESKSNALDDLLVHQTGIMMRHVVPANNSCLFTSVYFIVSNGEMDNNKSNELRKIIASAVEKNPSKYNSGYLGMENSEYCTWILDANHWGGAIELAILSEHFKFEIVAVDTISLKMLRFGENCNYTNRIFLIYDGIHYDPLILELENDSQTIFPVSETKAMEMALEIAKEAKSSRQFTDIANFTISCQICKVNLRGDKEARDHAKATGHCEFGEL